MTDVMTDPQKASFASPPPKRRKLGWLRELALLPALVVVFIIGGLVDDTFVGWSNIVSILTASAALSLVVLGESLVLITGKFDLSLESTMGLAPALGAMVVIPVASAGFGTELPAVAGLLVIPLIGALVGFVNGFLIIKLQLNAFIVTLAMLTVLRGVQVGSTKGKTLFNLPDSFTNIATTTFAGLPMTVWLAALLFAVAGWVLRYHRVGRALYAIGGLAYTGYVGALGANQGSGMILQVFAAAVIGGVSLDGGKGTLVGALTGVLLLSSVSSLLNYAHVSAEWQGAIYGAIILVALIIARYAGGKPQT